MRDDFYSAAWAGNRQHLSAAIGEIAHKLGADIYAAFESLNRRNYEAPWRVARRRPAAGR